MRAQHWVVSFLILSFDSFPLLAKMLNDPSFVEAYLCQIAKCLGFPYIGHQHNVGNYHFTGLLLDYTQILIPTHNPVTTCDEKR